MNHVTSKDACEIAATELGLSDTSAYSTTTSGRPHGCIYTSLTSTRLAWNDPLQWNDTSVPCGTKLGYDEYDCLCKTSGSASIFNF